MPELRGVCFFYSDIGTGCFAFQDSRYISPDEKRWSHKGFHELKEGDHLTIYSKKDPNKIIWQGTISRKRLQKGLNRKTRWARWFLKEFPAKLIPAPDRS